MVDNPQTNATQTKRGRGRPRTILTKTVVFVKRADGTWVPRGRGRPAGQETETRQVSVV